jgi:hypothetical protein
MVHFGVGLGWGLAPAPALGFVHHLHMTLATCFAQESQTTMQMVITPKRARHLSHIHAFVERAPFDARETWPHGPMRPTPPGLGG